MRVLTNILGKVESVFRRAKNQILRNTDAHFAEVERWNRDDPRDLKRTTFDNLTASSLVIDLGGYEGDWTSDLFSRYLCKIHVFEPVPEYASVIAARFKKNPHVVVHQSGLAPADARIKVHVDEFKSKLTLSGGADDPEVQLIDIGNFLTQNSINRVDLVKINIEGAEFDLLEHLLATGLSDIFHAFLIQFHPWEKNAVARKEKIHAALSARYELVFHYPFVWEYWQKR